jgi:PAS domain S-box-containing protein
MNTNTTDLNSMLKFYDTIFQNSQSGIFVSKWDGTLIHCNDSFYKIFGFESKEDIMSSTTWSCYENAEERNRYLAILELKEEVKNYTLTAVDKKGEKILYELNSNLIEQNGEKYIAGNVVELTHLESSKLKQAYQQKIYQDLFENSLEIIQSFDAEGRLLFCNKTWHEKLEYSAAEIPSLNLFDIIADEYKEHCGAMFMEVIAGKSFSNIEVEFVSKSGKRVMLEGNIVPLFMNGSLQATHGFFRDITDKKLAIDKALEQEKLLTAIFDTLPICLYVKNTNGAYLHANRYMEKTLGSNIVGEKDDQVFDKEVCSILKSTDLLALETPENVVTFDIEFNNGEFVRNYICGKKSFRNEDKAQNQIFGFAIDITETFDANKKYNEEITEKNNELRKINSELDRFVYSVSHDLRSPLLSVKGLVNLIMGFDVLDSDIVNCLKLIELSVDRLDATILDILTYSRNSRTELKIETVNIKEIVEDTYNDLNMLNSFDIDFIVYMQDCESLNTDKLRIQSVIRNLISNSIKYRREDGIRPLVKFTCIRKADFYEFEISDNGKGIAHEYQAKVFDMFFRASSDSIGTGLGLYIVNEIVQKLGANISLVSEPGQGTSIRIALPILEQKQSN